jgi:hypothetical protein
MIKFWWSFGLAGAVVLGVVGTFGLTASGNVRFGAARPDAPPAWVRRIALVDEALGRADVSLATYRWREAYGAALSSGHPEGLIAVGDRAIRIAELSSGSGYFRGEARYVYMHAAYRARGEGSRDTVLGIAERFEKLGELERAEQVRRIAASAS